MSEKWTRVWVPGPTYLDADVWIQYSSNFSWNNRAKALWLYRNVELDNFRVYKNTESSKFGWWLEFRYKQDAIRYKLKWAGDETDNRPPA